MGEHTNPIMRHARLRFEERNTDLTLFLHASNVQQSTSHTYQANVDPQWNYGRAAHGGFLIALAWRAVEDHFRTTLRRQDQPDTFSFHTEFLRPTFAGAVEIELRDIRLGKASSTLAWTLRQAGKATCEGFATNENAAARGGISKDLGYRREPDPPPVDFEKALEGCDDHWIRYDILQEEGVPNQTLGNHVFLIQRAPGSDQPRVSQLWICPRLAAQNWTTPMLGILIDLATPTPENYFDDAKHGYAAMATRAVQNERAGTTSWDHPRWDSDRVYNTLNFHIEVKRQLPPEGVKWLAIRWQTREIVNGRFDGDVEVWDAAGRLIAIASSVWSVVLSSQAPTSGVVQRQQAKWLSGNKPDTKL